MSLNFTNTQLKAIDHVGSDILVSAGAGSGKTTALTERIIRKILNGDDITKKLIVTYTKEAANKLKSDITDKFASTLNEITDESQKEHLKEQIVKVSTADISTIHSFCLKLIRPNVDKLPIDGDFRIGEDNEIDYIKAEVMKELVEELYEAKTPSKDFLLVSDCYSEISEADSLDKKLLSLYNTLSSTSKFLDILLDSNMGACEFMDTPYGKVLTDEILMLVNHYRPIYESIVDEITRIDGSPKFINGFIGDLNHMAELEKATDSRNYLKIKHTFMEYTALPLSGISKSGISDPDYAQDIRDEFKKKRKQLFDSYFSYEKSTLDFVLSQNHEVCKAIYNILSKFDKQFKERKRKYGLCDFNDLERFAYQLLCKGDDKARNLADEIAEEYNEIYIDEYQDTNSLQDDIFSAIARNNRFMVGDIKQSIYRFRSAEPEIFSHYRSIFEDITDKEDVGNNGKAVFMSENFRCDKPVINLSNDVSDYMFFNSDGIPYVKKDNLICKQESDNPQNCEICLLDRAVLKDVEGVDPDETHKILQAKYVAQRINDIIKAHTDENGNVNIELSKIAILLRKGKYKKYYIDALSDLGIDSEYIDDVKFFEKPHVLVLLSILNVIDNPYKDTYLAGALSSPAFNFSMDELLAIRTECSDKKLPLYSALLNYKGNAEIEAKINDFMKQLTEMQNDIKKMSSFEAISYVMNRKGLISRANKQERRDMIKLYNQARAYEKGSYKGLYKFLNYIESIKNSTSKENVFTSPKDCVRIMTIHASKGLEFDYCFVCNTEAEFSLQDSTDPLLFERHLGIAGYIGNDDSLVKYNTILRKLCARSITKASIEEEMRVLYVAMTRARKKLIITASINDLEKKLKKISKDAPFTSKRYLYSQKTHIDFILNAVYLPRKYVDLVKIDALYLLGLKPSEKKEQNIKEELVDSLQSTLKERFEFKYKFDYLNKLPSKISVSRIKKNMLDETENNEIDLTKELKRKPRFLEGDVEVEATGADKGTATHVFMQFCDFDKLEEKGYEAELKRLLDNSFITPLEAGRINEENIEAFAKSNLFDMMKKSKSANKIFKREFRFNVMLPADELTKDPELKKQNVLVQGVVDAVFIDENDKLILVDYKTDNVTEENYKDILKPRYTRQLSYYKKAIEIIFGRNVDHVYLYSVPLAKEVELKF